MAQSSMTASNGPRKFEVLEKQHGGRSRISRDVSGHRDAEAAGEVGVADWSHKIVSGTRRSQSARDSKRVTTSRHTLVTYLEIDYCSCQRQPVPTGSAGDQSSTSQKLLSSERHRGGPAAGDHRRPDMPQNGPLSTEVARVGGSTGLCHSTADKQARNGTVSGLRLQRCELATALGGDEHGVGAQPLVLELQVRDVLVVSVPIGVLEGG